MKKIILIIILLVGSKGLSAQSYMNLTTYQDTANYLIHEVEMKKNLFKNKPFQVLLNINFEAKLLKYSYKNILDSSMSGKSKCFCI